MQAQIGVTDEEMQAFLKGMLVTSNIEPPNEPTWPTGGDKGLLAWVSPVLAQQWGLKTADEIRRYTTTPLEQMRGPHAYALEALQDWPTAAKVWKHVLDEEPRDLDAAIRTARMLDNLGTDPREIADVIAKAPGAAPVHRTSAPKPSAAQLEDWRCYELFRARKLAAARSTCNAAIQIDEGYGSRTLTRILMAMGQTKDACSGRPRREDARCRIRS
jgi:hypothetical protein